MSAQPAWFGDQSTLRGILEASPHSVVGVDPDGVIGFVNARTLQTFGYTRAELLGAPVELLLPDDVVDPATRTSGLGLEARARRRDGTLLPVELSLTPVAAPEGPWVLCAITDVTSRRATEDRLERVTQAYRTMAALNEAIVLAETPRQLYAETCRIAVDEGGYLGAWVARRTAHQGVETLATAGGLDDYIARVDITLDPSGPRGHGPTATALRTGHAVHSSDFATDTAMLPWQEQARAYGIRSSMTLPLTTGGETVAVLNLWSAEPRHFDEQLRTQLSGLASNVSFALDGFVASTRLARLVLQRSELLRRVVAAQEQERSRIAADVHDDSVQALAAVDLRLGLLARRVQGLAPELASSVAQLQDTVASVTTGLRHLLFDLEAPDIHAGFDEALREAASHLFDDSRVRWSVTVEGADPAVAPSLHLSEGVHAQALRIVKEALINVRRHARAATVRVVVREVSGGVEVEVTDDGVGVGTDPVTSAPGHRGVSTMRDRAVLVGGWFRIEPAEQGTTVRLWVPRGNPPAALAPSHQTR